MPIITAGPVDQLIPFTGLYNLDRADGGFILIDTKMSYADTGGPEPVLTNSASVTISLNNFSSGSYGFADYGAFDGRTLTVTFEGTEIARLELSKHYEDGNVSALKGHAYGEPVAGKSPFNPITLPVFAGEYFDYAKQLGRLIVGSDCAVFYRPEETGVYVRVGQYDYDYAMFVITIHGFGPDVLLEMGTAPAMGKAAGNMSTGSLWFTVRDPHVFPAPAPHA
ncbi:MAG TPA: hypothetical protein VHZ78_13485 [Rhizomicrobium sp.]|jgi:hypothetical protein|nr:hypothetical protein [Rhizomicrobium sp.]